MPNWVKTVDIELSGPIQSIENLKAYQVLRGLLRWQGAPVGYIEMPVNGDRCAASEITKAVLAQGVEWLKHNLVYNRLTQSDNLSWQISELLRLPPNRSHKLLPVTVALCLERIEPNLMACLAVLQQSIYPKLDVLIVDASTEKNELAATVAEFGDRFHYHASPAPSLNAARNFAIQTAKGDILAFLDGSVIPASDWVDALAAAFAEQPQAAAIAGLAIQAESTSASQIWFEQRYSLWRGFQPAWHAFNLTAPIKWNLLGTWQIGTGANLAFRRRVFDQIGGFDLALDQAQLTEGGSDMDLLGRLLLAGEQVFYEPKAIVYYNTPATEAELRSHICRYITSFYAYLSASSQRYPKLKLAFFKVGLWQLLYSLKSLLLIKWFPRRMILMELLAISGCQGKYTKAQQTQTSVSNTPSLVASQPAKRLMAVRTIEVNQPLPTLRDVTDYQTVRVFVRFDDAPIGYVDIENNGRVISPAWLARKIAFTLADELLAVPLAHNQEAVWASLQTALRDYLQADAVAPAQPVPAQLAPDVPVSIIVTTCDRPDDLEVCLQQLLAQETHRPVEIVVADNRPASGLTAPVVAKFSGVKLVSESRPGASYGRNAAIAVTTGDIIVSVDDDVTVPTDWLEKLIAPMARPEVMMVTGNVLPKELETPAQLLYEQIKGGLSSGFKPLEANGDWFYSYERSTPPIWELGVSANAAYRASIFCHPQIGLMDEVLGPGTPTIGGEEVLLMYKVLKAGYTILYEPKAYVWHRHRRELKAFYRQIYGHMKGGTAYLLALWLKEKDPRAFRHLFFELPRYYSRRCYERLRGFDQTPWQYIWSEVSGYVTGFLGYWQSCQRVKKLGYSQPYIPVSERNVVAFAPTAEEIRPLPIQPHSTSASTQDKPSPVSMG
ncbi:MAG TPA: glycosyltransferase [Leptolyngbyaceae cyanobacterium M33_DOE_097]|uniref:Glycosyltransferase n=1 Tax=Oscillatoriales cyanobacterium SpSt-418 TaxID=2282169 RepID=A0A7C3PB70_9CYAN|nr:glycosyltransferase [Leptolyngbyaceae cyanobacterium M33_DOE_097]